LLELLVQVGNVQVALSLVLRCGVGVTVVGTVRSVGVGSVLDVESGVNLLPRRGGGEGGPKA